MELIVALTTSYMVTMMDDSFKDLPIIRRYKTLLIITLSFVFSVSFL